VKVEDHVHLTVAEHRDRGGHFVEICADASDGACVKTL
jgi:hypothetical protein